MNYASGVDGKRLEGPGVKKLHRVDRGTITDWKLMQFSFKWLLCNHNFCMVKQMRCQPIN